MKEMVFECCYIIAVAGGLIIIAVAGGLFASTFPITAKRNDVPRWTLNLLALVGVFGACSGGLGLASLHYSSHLGSRIVNVLNDYRKISAGVVAGLFLAWCVSGEFTRLCKLCKKKSDIPRAS